MSTHPTLSVFLFVFAAGFFALVSTQLAWSVDEGPVPREERESIEMITEKAVILQDQRYHVSLSEKGDPQGTYAIKAIEHPNGQIEFKEIFQIVRKGRPVSYSTVVKYGGTPLAPIEATSKTTIDGELCSIGSMRFKDDHIIMLSTGYRNDRTGEPYDKPRSSGEIKRERPMGSLVFQSALAVMGPKLLPKFGELNDVVFLLFPDDVGYHELVTIKNRRLVRNQSNEQGFYSIALYGHNSEEPQVQISYDHNDQVSAIRWQKFTFQKITSSF